MQHTANQLQQWVREPNLGVKSFAKSLLSLSRSICLPYQGVLLGSSSNPQEGLVLCAESCSRYCSNRKCCCHCQSLCFKNQCVYKVRESIEPIVECARKRATITKISRNPALVGMEIRALQDDENRRLRHQLARVILFGAIEKDGAILPDDAMGGDQIRKVVEIMDKPISKALQSGVATVELELWQVHAEHISKVYEKGRKG